MTPRRLPRRLPRRAAMGSALALLASPARASVPDRLTFAGLYKSIGVRGMVLVSPVLDFGGHSAAFDPLRFASACEDGSVQCWDLRRPDAPLRRFIAHSGLVLALAFHPSRRGVLATGGRDRLVKVWSLGGRGGSH